MKEPVIELNGWQTIANFAKQQNKTTMQISSMILNAKRRPDTAKILFKEYPELNNLKLVKFK